MPERPVDPVPAVAVPVSAKCSGIVLRPAAPSAARAVSHCAGHHVRQRLAAQRVLLQHQRAVVHLRDVVLVDVDQASRTPSLGGPGTCGSMLTAYMYSSRSNGNGKRRIACGAVAEGEVVAERLVVKEASWSKPRISAVAFSGRGRVRGPAHARDTQVHDLRASPAFSSSGQVVVVVLELAVAGEHARSRTGRRRRRGTGRARRRRPPRPPRGCSGARRRCDAVPDRSSTHLEGLAGRRREEASRVQVLARASPARAPVRARRRSCRLGPQT